MRHEFISGIYTIEGSEGSLIPARLTLDLYEIATIMESLTKGEIGGTTIYMKNKETYWVSMPYDKVKKLLPTL